MASRLKFDKENSLKAIRTEERQEEKPMPLIIGSRASLAMIAVFVNEIARITYG